MKVEDFSFEKQPKSQDEINSERALHDRVEATRNEEEFSYPESVIIFSNDVEDTINLLLRQIPTQSESVLGKDFFVEQKKYFIVKRKELEAIVVTHLKEIQETAQDDPVYADACQKEIIIIRELLAFLHTVIEELETYEKDGAVLASIVRSSLGEWRADLESRTQGLLLKDPQYRQEQRILGNNSGDESILPN